MKRFGFLDKTVSFLQQAGMETRVFEGVEPAGQRPLRCLAALKAS
jgi:alcohol dehydrogenase YqhD (iron-dependent ADH family)